MSKAILRVLVMEAASRSADLLRSGGFEVEHATEFSLGLERLAEGDFDLVLLELNLAHGKGLEPLIKAQAAFPQAPFVLLIDPAQEDLGREALRLGAQDYVMSPELTAAELASTARKAILRHQSQRASRRDRHLLEILIEKIPDAIYFKDIESRFLRISRAHAKKFNLSNPAGAIGRTDADFFSEAHALQARADEQEAMRTGKPLVDFEEKETWPDGSETWVSTTKMPLRDPSGKTIGTFGISRDITGRKLAEQALAERTNQLQQKNRQIEEELNMARELQLAMLPQKFPCVQPTQPTQSSALDFFSFFFPSGTVSGDFFDVIELSDTAVGVFICDVMGHDVRAALVTAMMRSLVKDFSHAATDPGQLLAQINRGLAAVFRQTGATMFATAFYLIVDTATGELRYASAAHRDALHLRRSQGKIETLIGSASLKGPALGLFEESVFPTCRRALSVGDLILLFTDGLVEAAGPNLECYSQERLAAAVQRQRHLPANELMTTVIAEVRGFCENGEFNDDVCLVGLEIKRLNAAQPGAAGNGHGAVKIEPLKITAEGFAEAE